MKQMRVASGLSMKKAVVLLLPGDSGNGTPSLIIRQQQGQGKTGCGRQPEKPYIMNIIPMKKETPIVNTKAIRESHKYFRILSEGCSG